MAGEGLNLDHYMAHSEEFERLSDDDKARLFAGETLEGETAAATTEQSAGAEGAESSGAPAAAATAETPKTEEPTTQEATAEPVVLAKDGKHTIPFSELEAARERAALLEQQTRDQAALIESLKQQAKAPEPTAEKPAGTEQPKPEAVDVGALEQQYLDAVLDGDKAAAIAIRNQINAELTRRAEESVTSRLKQEQSEREAETAAQEAQRLFQEQVDKTLKDFPFLDSASAEANKDAISLVVDLRDTYISKGQPAHAALQMAVERIAPMFAKPAAPATPEVTTKPSDDEAARQAAAEAIAKVKPKVPTSLSEIPTGAQAPHDEAAAIRDLSGVSLMSRFAGKTPDQIMELMSRVI